MIDFNKQHSFYFYGIKGAGMSALALILSDLGHSVTGSDLQKFFFTENKLLSAGIPIEIFDQELDKEYNFIIIGNAFVDSSIPVTGLKISYSVVLELLEKYIHEQGGKSIAISGTHGKTTTTKMISDGLSNIISLIGDGSGNANIDLNEKNPLFIYEACEYKNHFLNYNPIIGLINNIEYDHPDFFENENDVVASFQSFADLVQETLIINGHDRLSKKITHDHIFTFGISQDDTAIYTVTAKNIKKSVTATSFDLFINQQLMGRVELAIFGTHMILNVLATIAS